MTALVNKTLRHALPALHEFFVLRLYAAGVVTVGQLQATSANELRQILKDNSIPALLRACDASGVDLPQKEFSTWQH